MAVDPLPFVPVCCTLVQDSSLGLRGRDDLVEEAHQQLVEIFLACRQGVQGMGAERSGGKR